MNSRLARFVLLHGAWLVTAWIGATAAAAEPAAPTVQQVLAKYIALGEIPGAVTLVHEAGQTPVTTALGLSDVKSVKLAAPDDLFGIMSMTKPITATALMILVDEGKVSIDDPVEKFISAFKDAKLADGTPVEGLTIRHLLTHTSGLVGKQECIESLACTANLLAARPFGFRPGEQWQYSPGMNVVGRIIEIASGMPYDKFLRERIFVPLAMNETTFHPSDAQRARIASIYKKRKDGHSLEPGERWAGLGEADSVPNPSGGLFSTAADMDRFYSMILGGGELDGVRIVSADAVQKMTKVQTGDLTTGFTPGNGWGLGWCVVRAPQDVTGMLAPGTFGHGGAYGTQGWVDPVKKRIFVLMYQRSDAGNSDGAPIRKEFQQAAVDSLESR
jgi:CubicO group peptidase (beta-lactamase class C family)